MHIYDSRTFGTPDGACRDSPACPKKGWITKDGNFPSNEYPPILPFLAKTERMFWLLHATSMLTFSDGTHIHSLIEGCHRVMCPISEAVVYCKIFSQASHSQCPLTQKKPFLPGLTETADCPSGAAEYLKHTFWERTKYHGAREQLYRTLSSAEHRRASVKNMLLSVEPGAQLVSCSRPS